MAYIILDSGARKRVEARDAIRLQLAIKYPHRASERLKQYSMHVRAIEYEDNPPTIQGAFAYKEENREL